MTTHKWNKIKEQISADRQKFVQEQVKNSVQEINSRIKTSIGEVIWFEFMLPENLTVNDLVKLTGIDSEELGQIMFGKIPLTDDYAIKLGQAFGTSREFWKNIYSNSI